MGLRGKGSEGTGGQGSRWGRGSGCEWGDPVVQGKDGGVGGGERVTPHGLC